MILVFMDFSDVEALIEDECCSPEALLTSLEDKLDSGEMTIDEVRQYLADYGAKQR